MRRLVITMALLGCLLLLQGRPAQAQPAGRINVTFTNRTNLKVTFFLNGGEGLETRLNPGQSQTYDMAVDKGVQPGVSIFQASGKKLNFSVENGGRYVFRVEGGVIKNFFE